MLTYNGLSVYWSISSNVCLVLFFFFFFFSLALQSLEDPGLLTNVPPDIPILHSPSPSSHSYLSQIVLNCIQPSRMWAATSKLLSAVQTIIFGSILMLLIDLSHSNTSMTYVSLICLQNFILHITVIFQSNFEIY